MSTLRWFLRKFMRSERPSPKIVLYTRGTCAYCHRAREFFRSKNLSFDEIDLSERSKDLEELKQRTGHMTVPQIFIDDRFVGGYTDLIAAAESGRLRF